VDLGGLDALQAGWTRIGDSNALTGVAVEIAQTNRPTLAVPVSVEKGKTYRVWVRARCTAAWPADRFAAGAWLRQGGAVDPA
jgi:hypothetical protein